jgi:hypothetical protein
VNAAAGALFCSVLFYAVIAWGFIKLIAFLRSDTAQDRGAGGRHVGQ